MKEWSKADRGVFNGVTWKRGIEEVLGDPKSVFGILT